MSNPIHSIGIPSQRMLSQVQAPPGYAQNPYGAQADPYAQPQQYSPEQLAQLQQLQRQQQLQNQNIFSRTWNRVVDFFNKLPIWGKAILLVLGAFAGIRAGQFAGRNAYRIERLFRPSDRIKTMGDRSLTRDFHDYTDAKRNADLTAKEFDRTHKIMNEQKQREKAAYSELETQHGWWERKFARIGLGPKELRNKQRSADLVSAKAKESSSEHRFAATDHHQARLDQLYAESQLGEFRLEKLLERKDSLTSQVKSMNAGTRKTAVEQTLRRVELEIDWQREEMTNISNDIDIVKAGVLDPQSRTNSIASYIELLEQDWKLQVLNPLQQAFAFIFGRSSKPSDPFSLGMKKVQKATA